MLTRELRRAIADTGARSFRLAGEDLVSLTIPDLRAAADAYGEALATIPAALRAAVLEQHDAHARESHAWLGRYNDTIHNRVRGYLALAERTDYEIPWPIIAVLGVSQIMDGALGFHLIAAAAEWASRFGFHTLSEITAELDDMTRRTNRGIFADSVPMLLFAIRCAKLRREGRGDLADAILAGPAPITFDEASWQAVADWDRALAIEDAEARFVELAALTKKQFEREQAVFTHHIGNAFVPRGVPRWLARRIRLPSTRAPVVERTPDGARRVVFRARPLDAGFDMSAHDDRVRVLGRLFCDSVLGSVEDYRAAVKFVADRFA